MLWPDRMLMPAHCLIQQVAVVCIHLALLALVLLLVRSSDPGSLGVTL